MTAAAIPLVSVVSPVYCCAGCLSELCARVAATLAPVTSDYEIVLIDDGSPDEAWSVLRELSASDARIKSLRLSRNFGQHYAIAAGMASTRGEWVVVMDCDLQDRPEEITALLEKARGGRYDAVFGKRVARRDGWAKRFTSHAFYAVLNYLTGAQHDAETANFGVFSRALVDVINRMPEQSRCFPLMVKWTGMKMGTLAVDHESRKIGRSSYSLRKRIRLAIDIVLSYSDKPLRLVAKLGIGFAFLAILIACYGVYRYAMGDVSVAGYTSIIASIWLLAGIILFCLGVIGLYVGRTFENVKGRPHYIVRESLNVDQSS
jgi:glycosyltransferase involved in cell wall biosynthesis